MTRPRLDLNLLETFDAVCLSGSLKKAADHLNLSNSAVSVQIKRLEEAVGQRLLERNNQGLKVTAAGRYLLRRSRSLLQLETSTVSELIGRQVVGTMRIGVPADYAPTLLSVALPYLRTNFPDVEVTIECDLSRKLRPKVAAQHLDVAIVALDTTPPEGEVLWDEDLLWVRTRRSVFSGRQRPVGLLDVDCFIRDAALRASDTMNSDSRIAFRSTNLASVASAVHAGFCESLLPRGSLEADMATSDQFIVEKTDLKLYISLIRSDSDRDEIHPFCDFLLRTLRLAGNSKK